MTAGTGSTRSSTRAVIRLWLPNIALGPHATAERSLILAAAFVRMTGVIQTALALPMIARAAHSPVPTTTVAVLYIVESIAVTFIAIFRGKLPPLPQAMMDGAFCLFVLIQPAFWGTTGQVGSWSHWQFAAGMSIACYVALSLRGPLQLAILAVLNALAYLAGVLLGPTEGEVRSAYVNAVAFLCLVPAVYIVASYLRSLARHLAKARELNARLAADAAIAEERAAQRIVLHDTAGLLAMLGNNPDPEFDRVLRAQAQSISRDLRRRVYEKSDVPRNRTLHDLVVATTAAYGDLPTSTNTLLAKRHYLSTEAHATVSSALRTLLDNIRQHADADAVTIHAAATDDGWNLVVRDDGVGFDADAPLGFGLTEQVIGQCRLLGITVDIQSENGLGTAIELRGPASTLRTLTAADSRRSEQPDA